MQVLISVLAAFLLTISSTPPAWADLLVSSFDTSQVLRYDQTTGAFLGVFATGLPGDHPTSGLTVGPDNNLYVGANNFATPLLESFVRRFNGGTGAFIDTFASGGELNGPGNMVFGPDGNLYVASFGGLAPNSKVIRYNGVTGAFIDDFVPVGSGGLSGAEGLTFGPDGNLYVTSRVTDQVLRYNGLTGAFLGVFATGGNNGPIDLVFGPDGNLYVLNSTGGSLSILRFDGGSGAFLGDFVNSFPGGTDGSSLDFGPDGNLYVTTGFIGDSVLRFDGSTGQFIDEFVPGGSGGLSNAEGLEFFTPIPAPIPEPSTLTLLGLGVLSLAGWTWRARGQPRFPPISGFCVFLQVPGRL
jgi:sugar lactone lactonase YvrE